MEFPHRPTAPEPSTEAVLDEVPGTPQLTNTDGDPLEFHELSFELRCSPREAFDRLADLAEGEDPDVFLEGAEFEIDELRTVEFPWMTSVRGPLAGMQNTVLGTIRIGRGGMSILVNSERRARSILEEVARRLGDLADLREDREVSLQEGMEAAKNQAPDRSAVTSNQEDPRQRPEIQALLAEIAKQHWESWFDEAIPALDGHTPREAARTPRGRERLEALFREFRRPPGARGDPLLDPDVDHLRREFGMLGHERGA